MPKTAIPSLETLLAQIRRDYPDLSFAESTDFSWHAGQKHISFKSSGANAKQDTWGLLHELGHALLGHATYCFDIELLQLEAIAWGKARELAQKYMLEINEDYVQDCLDTYRDWLHLRATCPNCFARSLQASPRDYHCFNCGSRWQVSRSRLCRPYRLQTT
jgi:hypothetical protein